MKYSKVNQFWAWFKKHHATYLRLPSLQAAEIAYWFGEMEMHLAGYQRFLSVLLYLDQDVYQKGQLIFTASGKDKYFNLVERLLSKAPSLEGWEFVNLHPPVPLDSYIEDELRHLRLAADHFWFAPPVRPVDNEKMRLQVYIETSKSISEAYHKVADQAVYNVLGERAYGRCIDWVEVDSYFRIPLRKREQLIPLAQLGLHIDVREISPLVINEQGMIERRKRGWY